MKKKMTPAELSVLLQRAMDIANEPLADLDLDESILDVDVQALGSLPTRPPPPIAPASTKSEKISIRIQSKTLAAIRSRARVLGIPYQRLINQQLREAALALPHV